MVKLYWILVKGTAKTEPDIFHLIQYLPTEMSHSLISLRRTESILKLKILYMQLPKCGLSDNFGLMATIFNPKKVALRVQLLYLDSAFSILSTIKAGRLLFTKYSSA